jgi:hypothetical protein
VKALPRGLLLLCYASLLLGGDCMFGRPIVDERSRYYPTDGVISCSGTRCADLPSYELDLPPALDDSPCAQDLPTTELVAATQAGSSLAGMRYVLASTRPRDLNLGTLDVRDACLVLSGPVHLTLGARSKLTHVTVLFGPANPADLDASVMELDAGASPADAGPLLSDAEQGSRDSPTPSFTPVIASRATPNLRLSNVELDRVVLQASDEAEPSGSAQVEFSTCTQCETRIDSLDVTESTMMNSRLGAGRLNIVGGAFDTVEFSFDYGLLAGLLANDVRTASCKTLSLVGATIAGRASQIGPCACRGLPTDAGEPDADAGEPDAGEPDAGEPDAGEPDAICNGISISQTTFLAGMIDGKIHAENSSFQSVLFARHAPTALDIWNGEIKLSVFCDQPVDIRIDKTAGVGCTSCDAPKTTSACALNDAPKVLVNTCRSFRSKLPACKPPLPIMRSPFTPKPPKKGS